MRNWRIAVAGLHMECSTYNVVKARLEDFTILRGDALLAHEYFAFLKATHAHFLPLMHARAIAGGPFTRDVYEAFKTEICQGLAAAKPYDGIYLAMHGAMFVEGLEDAEADFIAAVRAVAGADCVVAVSYDLHGNVSTRIIDAIDIFSSYRTAPHIDVEETMRRSVGLLVRALQTGERPGIVWVPVPVLMPGERSSTEDEPAKTLYAQLPAIAAQAGIWDAALQVGYVWADEPRATAAAVLTGTEPSSLKTAASALAESYWNARHAFHFGVETASISDCVDRAMKVKTRPVIIADSGDNPTGGGVGDRADLLSQLIKAKAQDVIVAGLADAPVTLQAFAAGVGARLHCQIGGSLDPSSNPVTALARVVSLHGEGLDREAVLNTQGITVVTAVKRRAYHHLSDFARLGLEISHAKIIVLKSGYLSPELKPLANPPLMALSPGAVDQHIEGLQRLRKTGSTFPFDRDISLTFKPQVSARFGQRAIS